MGCSEFTILLSCRMFGTCKTCMWRIWSIVMGWEDARMEWKKANESEVERVMYVSVWHSVWHSAAMPPPAHCCVGVVALSFSFSRDTCFFFSVSLICDRRPSYEQWAFSSLWELRHLMFVLWISKYYSLITLACRPWNRCCLRAARSSSFYLFTSYI